MNKESKDMHPDMPCTKVLKPRSVKPNKISVLQSLRSIGSSNWNVRYIWTHSSHVLYGAQAEEGTKKIPFENIKKCETVTPEIMKSLGCDDKDVGCGWMIGSEKRAFYEKKVYLACETVELRDRWVYYLQNIILANLAKTSLPEVADWPILSSTAATFPFHKTEHFLDEANRTEETVTTQVVVDDDVTQKLQNCILEIESVLSISKIAANERALRIAGLLPPIGSLLEVIPIVGKTEKLLCDGLAALLKCVAHVHAVQESCMYLAIRILRLHMGTMPLVIRAANNKDREMQRVITDISALVREAQKLVAKYEPSPDELPETALGWTLKAAHFIKKVYHNIKSQEDLQKLKELHKKIDRIQSDKSVHAGVFTNRESPTKEDLERLWKWSKESIEQTVIRAIEEGDAEVKAVLSEISRQITTSIEVKVGKELRVRTLSAIEEEVTRAVTKEVIPRTELERARTDTQLELGKECLVVPDIVAPDALMDPSNGMGPLQAKERKKRSWTWMK